jgi:hypothetical protein
LEHARLDRAGKLKVIEDGREGAGTEQSMRRMVPSKQRLVMVSFAVSQVYDGLALAELPLTDVATVLGCGVATISIL